MKKYDKKCPVCNSDLILDDSETEVHCDSCEYTSTVEALEMCEWMCPQYEDDTNDSNWEWGD